MPRRKVLFLITKATSGGAQRYVRDLSVMLRKDAFDVLVVYGTKGALARALAESGVRTREVPSLGRDIAVISDIRSFFDILAILKKERPDIVHLNSSKAAALGALASRLAGVPRIVFTAHGWPFKEARDELFRVSIKLISWFTALLSHVVIVVSKEDESLGKHMAFISKKIRYIPLAISPIEFFERDDAANSLSVKEASKRVVTIAELTANKGLRDGLRAMAILKQRGEIVHYYLIGDGEEREDLEACAREEGISERVHFLGFIPDAARYLKAFDAFLLPSIKEGMPYVLLEAAQANLPIVTTDVVDPDFLRRHPAILTVRSGDPPALAEAILRALSVVPKYPAPHTVETMVSATTALYSANA